MGHSYIVLDFVFTLVLFFAGGSLNSNLKQQLSNCYAGRLAPRNLACYWRGLRPHYLSQSYYYLCLVPSLPPVLCRCPFNLVFEESVQTCVPGYMKGANSAALLHSYRTKWSNRHSHSVNNGPSRHSFLGRDAYENHVAVRPWNEGRKRHRRAIRDPSLGGASLSDPYDKRAPSSQAINTPYQKNPSSNHLTSNKEQIELLQLHQLSSAPSDEKNSLLGEGNEVNFNSPSNSQDSELLPVKDDGQGYVAEPIDTRPEKFFALDNKAEKHDVFPVWAIALASLCFVILLILIVLYLY